MSDWWDGQIEYRALSTATALVLDGQMARRNVQKNSDLRKPQLVSSKDDSERCHPGATGGLRIVDHRSGRDRQGQTPRQMRKVVSLVLS